MMTSDITDSIPASPYRGILSFRYVDRARFFGREEVTTELLAKTLVSRVVVLFGESGTGKSSLINAGLIPALEREGLCPERLRVRPIPGEPVLIERVPTGDVEDGHYLPSILVDDDPAGSGSREQFVPCTLERLLESVRGTDAYPVLIFDQFEELFTLFEQGQERGAQGRALQVDVLNTVLSVASDPRLRAKVIIVIREDYLGKLEVLARDYPQVFDRRIRLQRFVHSEARTAILGPFEDRNPFSSRLEGELAEQVIRDLSGGDPGVQIQPTQLQIICSRLWQAYAATRPVIGVKEYEELRKVQGIIEGFLESELAGLAPSSRSQAVVVLGQLITESDTRDVVSEDRLRALMATTEQIADDALLEILDFLERRRLVHRTPQRGTYYYEIGSEYLIPPVRREAREDAYYRAAEEAARQEREEALRRQAEMKAAAREREAKAAQSLAREAEARLQAEEARAREAEARAREQVRATKRMLRLVVALAAVFLVAVSGAVMAWMGWRRAEANAQIALSRQLAAQALSRLDDDLGLAMLLAAQAYHAADTLEARTSLLATLRGSPSLLTFLHGHSDQVTSLTFGSEGTTLISAGADGRVLSWNIATDSSPNRALALEVDDGSRMTLSPDGQTLALGFPDGTVALWDTRSDRGIKPPLVGHSDKVDALAFTPDGRMLASGGWDKRILLWDVEHGKRIGELRLAKDVDRPSSVALAPSADLLASGSADGTILLWNLATCSAERLPGGHVGLVQSLAFSPDGAMLASGGADGSLLLWDVESGEQLRQLAAAQTSQITSLAFSPNDTKLAYGSADGTLVLWDMSEGRHQETRFVGHSDGILSVVFSPDGTKLASGGTSGTVLLWDVKAAPFYAQPVVEHTSPASCVAFGPDRILALGQRDGQIFLRRTTADGFEEAATGHTDQISQLAFDPQGAALASSSWDGTIRLWNVDRGRARLMRVIDHADPAGSMVFGSGGSRLTSYGQGGDVTVWEVTTGERISLYRTGEPPEVSAAVPGRDGEILAAGYADGAIRLWRASKGEFLEQILRREGSRVASLAFTWDRQVLAWGDANGALVLWDVGTGTIIGRRAGEPSSSILALAFSPDGKTLASGDATGALTLWEVSEGTLSALPLTQRGSAVVGLAFSADGEVLASLDAEGAVTLWDVSADSWRDHACRTANRSLTLTEWSQFMGDEPYHQACPDGR